MNKNLVRAVAATLIGLQLAGCANTGDLKQSAYALSRGDWGGVTGDDKHSPNYHKGPLKPEQRAQAEVAASISRATASGVVGYSQPEYQRRLADFRRAKSAYQAAGNQVTESQFLALSNSLRDLLLYVDLVESGSPKIAARSSAKPLVSSTYAIPSGASADFTFNGFCVRSSLRKAGPGEAMQLLPDDQMWGEYLPQYRKLMASRPDLPPLDMSRPGSNPYAQAGMADHQVALWALRGIGDSGVISPTLASSLSPTHKQLLLEAGTPPSAIATSQVAGKVVGQLYDGALSSIGDMAGRAISGAAGASGVSTSQVRAGMNTVRSLGLSPDEMLANPAVLNNPAALSKGLEQWVFDDEPGVPLSGVSALDQYSVIAPAVSARTVSGGKLSGTFRITNLSGQPFTFDPDRYIANARSASSQPAALARTGLTQMGPAYTVDKPGKGLPADLMADLMDLAGDKLLDSITGDKAFLADVGGLFKSKAVQGLLGSIPVVGNVLSLGTLIAGVNLDGSPMDSMDYAQAAIGVIPVVGNLGKLGVVGGRATAGFVAALGSGKTEAAVAAIDMGLEISSKESFQQLPDWMSGRFSAISDQIAADVGVRG